MATETAKNLGGGSIPAGGSLTALYTVAAATSVVVSTIACCNQGANPAKIRISHAIAGAADTPSQYVEYDRVVGPNSTFYLTIGITMATTDVLRVRSDTGTVSFNAWGEEIT